MTARRYSAVLFGLFVAQEKSLDQGNDANPDQDHWANDHPRNVGRLDDPDDDWDGTEKGQGTNASHNFATKCQFCAAGEADGEHDARPPSSCEDQNAQADEKDAARDSRCYSLLVHYKLLFVDGEYIQV